MSTVTTDYYDYKEAVKRGIQDGKDEYSEGTFECSEYPGCLYQLNERCVYNISKIQQRVSKACYNDIKYSGDDND